MHYYCFSHLCYLRKILSTRDSGALLKLQFRDKMKLNYIGVLSRTEFDSSIQFLNFGLGSEKNDWNDAKIGLS